MNLKHFTDKQLLIETKAISLEEKKTTLRLLHHLREINERKLYSDLGYSCLYNYIVYELGYSSGAATRRINSFHVIAKMPEVEKKIENGQITLTNLSKAADLFKKENITDKATQSTIIKNIENTTSRECEKVLSEIKNPALLDLPTKSYQVISVSVSDETYARFDYLRGLMGSLRLSKEEIFAKIFELSITHFEKKKFGTQSKLPPLASSTRYIPMGLRKAVFERDKGACVICGSTYDVELDHIESFALGGKTTLENLRLLCRNCNDRARIRAKI